MKSYLLKDLEKEGIVTLGRGQIISKDDMLATKGDYPVYSSSATGNGEFGRYGKYMFDDERITWSIDGGGRLFYRDKHKYSVTNVCGWIKVNKPNMLNTKFLYYCLYIQWLDINFDYTFKAHPSKIREIYKVVIPNMEEQVKMVDLFSKIEENIAINNRKVELAKELIKSRFIEMFENENNTCLFETVVKNMTKGPFGSDIKKSLYVPKGEDTYKVYIQVNAIEKNHELGDYYISKEYFDKKMNRFEVHPKDYLITCDGTLGKYIRLPDDIERGIISASLLRLTLNESKIAPKFFEVMWDNYLLPKLVGMVRNGCLKHLPSAKDIGKQLIPLPKMEQQLKFNDFVTKVDKQISLLEEDNKKYRELLSKKMDEYFN